MKTKKVKQSLIVVALGLISLTSSVAQDIMITKKNNKKVKVKIIEIGAKEIKYKFYDSQDGPTITVNKNELICVKINGNEENTLYFNDDPMLATNKVILDKTQAIKFHFFSPLSGYAAIDYEWMQKPGFNWEVGGGIIGAGHQEDYKARGVFLRGGPKFLLGQKEDIVVDDINYKYAHPLKGRYIKIEAFVNAFTETREYQNWNSSFLGNNNKENITINYQSIGMNLIYGRQYIVGNALTINWYAGIGYSGENRNIKKYPTNYDAESINYNPRKFNYNRFDGKSPLTFTSGLAVGYIFKYKSSNSSMFRKKNIDPSRISMNNNK